MCVYSIQLHYNTSCNPTGRNKDGQGSWRRRGQCKGPVAAGGLAGPPLGAEGQREAPVITQEDTGSSSPSHSPTSYTSEHSLSQECDTVSSSEDTSAACVSCVSEIPSSSPSSPQGQDTPTRHLHTLSNSDSEYESAEELDSPVQLTHQAQEVSPTQCDTDCAKAEGSTRENITWGDSEELQTKDFGDTQTDVNALPCVVNDSLKSIDTDIIAAAPLHSVETVSSAETTSPEIAGIATTSSVITDIETAIPETKGTETISPELTGTESTSPETTGTENFSPESIETENTVPETAGSETISPEITSCEFTSEDRELQGQTENSPSTVCESVVTITKNEVIEESLLEKTVLIDQHVITATHSSSPSVLENTVDISEIDLDIVAPSNEHDTGSGCEVIVSQPHDLSGNLSKTKETSDPVGVEDENVHVCVDDGQVIKSSVPEIRSEPEGGLNSPEEGQNTPLPHLECGLDKERLKEKEEVQEATDTFISYLPEQPSAPQDFNQSPVPYLPPEYKEESPPPPPTPPPDPEDIPITPHKTYNLDFLDNLDDPNFNPFASKTTIRNTPPPSPEPGRKLPPLKPAVRKKVNKTQQPITDCQVEPNNDVAESQVKSDTQGLPGRDRVSESPLPNKDTDKTPEIQQKSLEHAEKPEDIFDEEISVKTPRKPVRKPLQRKPIRKAQQKPKVTEKNNNRVEEEEVTVTHQKDEELPISPSKGYNLNFLDNLDDPNFNPFASKTAIRNSPPSAGPDFPTTNCTQGEAGEQKAKVVVAKKTSPARKGFRVAKETNKDSPEVSKVSTTSQVTENQEASEVSEISKAHVPETIPTEEKHVEEGLQLPKKGYNLDFLDDPNFDPFQSKSSLDRVTTAPKVPTQVLAGSSDQDVADSGSALTVIKSTDTETVENIVKSEEYKTETVLNKDNLDKVIVPSDGSKNSEEHLTENPSLKVYREEAQDETVVEGKSNGQLKSLEPKDSEFSESLSRHIEEIQEITDKPKTQNIENFQNSYTKEINQTSNQNLESPPDSGNSWDSPGTEPHSGTFSTPSLGTVGQLDSLEFDQLLEHEASRLAEEFMNCSRDSGLADSDESTHLVKPGNLDTNMADMNCSNSHQQYHHLDENVNPFQRSSRMAGSPPLGKRGAVCGAESSDPIGLPFTSRRSLKRDIVMGEERLDTASLDDDSGIVLGSRSDLETEVNHSEAGPEIATGLTSSDLRCASQSNSDDLDEEFYDQITDEEFLSSETFFKEATDLENQMRRTLVSPLMSSHSKLSGDEVTPTKGKLNADEVTPTKDKKEPPSGAPESPQNKPIPSTSSPAPPPREERSAPEGTSSPSPRPNDTAERKSLSARPTSAPPEGYMTASEVQELLKRQELKFEEKLLRVELAAGEKEKKLQQTMKDEQKELMSLGSSVTELTQSRDALLKMVAQYKGMLASLVTEKEKEKKVAEERISTLEAERNQALEDLANVEVAFSDVHRKYERTKQVVDTLKRNEETLRGAVADYEAKLKKQEQKFLEFQKHAEEKIQMANEEFESMRKANEQEMTKMAALLKKAEMKIMSLQDSFDRKTRENQELTQLCDDLINKVGTSH